MPHFLLEGTEDLRLRRKAQHGSKSHERHGEAAIGHATSEDLINWTLHPNIFESSNDSSFDY